MSTTTLPIHIDDPINAKILAVSEDRVQGFVLDPFEEISRLSGVALPLVHERIRAMLAGGTIRRVRQTLLATNLASGALVAWQVPEARLTDAFDWMFQQDPFTGHVVIRSTDSATAGSVYRLWTTVKTPQGYSLEKHCQHLAGQTGADGFRIMPARCVFTLGVGHVRRKSIEPGDKAEQPGEAMQVTQVQLSEQDWQVLEPLKRELAVDEIGPDLWANRAQEAGVSLEQFIQTAQSLQQRGVIGRFSTFLEHVKPLADGQRVTRFNALFHWAVPQGQEIQAGCEVGRFDIMTHAYWRDGGPAFKNVNIMGVAHGTDKARLLAHKNAIDLHLKQQGIPVSYTNIFWGGRSEIKPSEISPIAYRAWCKQQGLDADSMRS